MRPDKRDAAYLWDMLDAAMAVKQFVSFRTYKEYQQDRLLRNAVERNIEIIGEAANNISDAFQMAHPEIPWKKITSQRNVLVHEYGEIKHERIWIVATKHIPELIEFLQPLLPPNPISVV